jgi:uncharacterized membrane protein (UPF0127 family)
MLVANTIQRLHAQRLLFFILAVSCFCVAACRSASSLPTVSVTIESPQGVVSEAFSMEVAATPQERSKGLMFRRSLDSRAGMLFLFPEPAQLAFWMKNTFIPLDMVFVSSDWRVVGSVENVPPQTETPRQVSGESQYVLEFVAGTVKRIGVEQGAKVLIKGQLPPIQ